MRQNYKNMFVLLYVFMIMAFFAGCSGKNHRAKHSVKLGETYYSAALQYTVTEDISTKRLILSIVDNGKFNDKVMTSVIVYPDDNFYPIQTKTVVFDGKGESKTFLLPYMTDSLPLYIDFQENYNQFSEGNDVINSYSLNWGFKVEK